ncbi:hypothetical protein GTO91_13745 [Heliobacterium undosum]|uniref:Uncharacterized protein n=1 Tax=Heliomicrobium undosum TaxID=121734 RepID=A0A845L2I5_9FIRM|nr:YwmB family TATA-box binding protein [Heliomicrobium undosum]MZP30777.1 hypothetical protein [Heliomicrobium undosum]
MLKFLFYLIVQVGLFLFLSFFLLFRNGGEGAQWVIRQMPSVEATVAGYVRDYTPSLLEVWTTLAPPFGNQPGKRGFHERGYGPASPDAIGPVQSPGPENSTDEKGRSAAGATSETGHPDQGTGEGAGKRIDPAVIESLASAMQASGISPQDAAVTLSMPVDSELLNAAEEKERRLVAETLLKRHFREIAGQDAAETPVIRIDGHRLFALLRGNDGKGSRLDLMLQSDGERGHLTAVLREPLADVKASERLKRLYGLADGRGRCEFSLSLQGIRPGFSAPEEQERVISDCLARLQAQPLRSSAKEAVVISAYCPLLPGGIRMGDENMNLQAMARYYGVDRNTHFAFGYPLLIQEM